jgi:hypothetical protein
MKMQCSYCGKRWQNSKRLAPGLLPGTVSHGVCEVCAKLLDKSIDEIIKKREAENDKQSGKL